MACGTGSESRNSIYFSALGIISTLLTGGIGLLELSRNWMIAKETVHSPHPIGIIGTRLPLARVTPLLSLLFSQIIDLDRVEAVFQGAR